MLALYHAWDSIQSFKVRFCLEELQLDWESRPIALTKLEHLSADFLAINPGGLVPVLVCNDGFFYESSIINEYLEEQFGGNLLTAHGSADRARIRAWCRYQDTVVHQVIRPPTFNLYIKNRIRQEPAEAFDRLIASHPNRIRAEAYQEAVSVPPDAAAVMASLVEIIDIIRKIDVSLAGHAFLIGGSLTLADIAMGAFVERLDALGLGRAWAPYPAALHWAEMIRALPSYRRAAGSQELLAYVDVELASSLLRRVEAQVENNH